MRLTTVAALTALSMTLTSAAVWLASSPAEAARDPAPLFASGPPALGAALDFSDVQAATPVVDRSTFVSGDRLMLEGRLGHARMLADRSGETLLFVDVRSEPESLPGELGTAGEPRTTAEPLNLAIVIDGSGSMAGKRERNATAAAIGMVSRLRVGDSVSVVRYASRAQVLLPAMTIDERTRERAIAVLQHSVNAPPKGNTCISCGIEIGIDTLLGRRPGIERLLLLSDGEANRGVTTPAGMRELARQARARGATISTVGVDVDYNQQLMSALAREGNGHHHFAATAAQLGPIFTREFDSLAQTVATDGMVTVELAPGVRVLEVFDRSFEQVGRQLRVPMGEFSVGQSKTLLVRLELPPSPVGERPVASVSLDYRGAAQGFGRGEPRSCFGELATRMTTQPARVSPLDVIVLNRLTRSETSRALEQANELFAQGRIDEARGTIARHRGALAGRRKKAKKRAGAGIVDPFGRNLDEDFDNQAQAVEAAAEGFEQAAGDPAPTSSRPAKAQVRRNAESADALAL